ncbi:HEAT repeat domain-containing protein [Micromonospora sp. DT53]|uniref:HEAT repeat domain-containing protein n=1 Tax=Micromonospora sp. DT53 TaxID=3393444 RepID=UPI003CEF6FEE
MTGIPPPELATYRQFSTCEQQHADAVARDHQLRPLTLAADHRGAFLGRRPGPPVARPATTGVTLVAGLAEAAGQLDTTSPGRRYCRDQLLVQARAEASTAVRQAAVRALVAHFSADPDLIDMLSDLADSPDPAVRAIAVHALGGRVESSEDIRQLLLARATEDPPDCTARDGAPQRCGPPDPHRAHPPRSSGRR